MKKIGIKVLAFCILLVLLLVLTGCGNKEKAENENSSVVVTDEVKNEVVIENIVEENVTGTATSSLEE